MKLYLITETKTRKLKYIVSCGRRRSRLGFKHSVFQYMYCSLDVSPYVVTGMLEVHSSGHRFCAGETHVEGKNFV